MVDAKLTIPAVSNDIIFLLISPAEFKSIFLYPADFYRGRCPYSSAPHQYRKHQGVLFVDSSTRLSLKSTWRVAEAQALLIDG